jgi:antirestriction protein ArdC
VSEMNRHERYDHEVVARLIQQMEQGTSPFQVPWDREAGTGFSSPYNPSSGKCYRSGNLIHLWCAQQEHGYGDNRWLTYKQAAALGAQVRGGGKATWVKYWDFPDEHAPAPVGETEEERAKRLRPKVFYAAVFNADQIEGMPARTPRSDVVWERDDCKHILDRLGVPVHHGGNEAYYVPSSDEIYVPQQAQFHSESAYWAVLLHEGAHATGHPSRLARDLTGKFATESYAKEELIAETASLLMGERLGIGFDFGQHASYVQHWIKLLRDDPRELYRAAAAAEKACEHLGVHALVREPLKAAEQVREQGVAREEHESKAPHHRPTKAKSKAKEMVMAM